MIGRWRATAAAAGLLASVLPARGAAQGTFEGTVSYQVSRAGQTMVMKVYQLGNKLRQEMQIQGQTATSIYDGATGDATILIPQRKQYMVMNLKQMSDELGPMARALSGGTKPSADLSKMNVRAGAKPETIAGIACDHYVFTNEDSEGDSVDVCGASGMGFLGFPGQSGSVIPSTAALRQAGNAELAKLANAGFFPLKVTVMQEGDTTAIDATAVDRTKPDAALFEPPAGYTRITMPKMPGEH